MSARQLAHRSLRQEIIATACKMNALGINQGKSGNLSHRIPEGFLVTPTGMDYDALDPADIVPMGFDGAHRGARLPSSEWRFHRDILKARPEANAVIHTHSMFATTLACLGREIPAFHYMVAVAGADSIRCAPYATFGTEALSRHAVRALEGRMACLLANHGMIALGDSLKSALALAVEVETLAAMYWRALQVGEPNILDAAEMARVIEKFRTYGQQTSSATLDPHPPVAARRVPPSPARGRGASRRRG
ncbi:MAG TPA: class II aldolase/adducin family protein [Stellaceae bacterium]|nr:class II aldolase/adducin family protein [Stellaceae bacterium]